MIAIDTNVLLRYLLWDDEEQATKADKLLNGSTQVLITDVVLTETLWTLKGKKYKLAKPKMIDVINSLFEEPNICFEDGQVVWRALRDYTQAKAVNVAGKRKEVDFADALIVNKARQCAGGQGKALAKFFPLMWQCKRCPERRVLERTANNKGSSLSLYLLRILPTKLDSSHGRCQRTSG